ncbi:Zinc finger CCHC domain-containing protein 4 [Orchesella cincta]|uniref:Zinc finger CCHC domain-containing protein 4 n=1 Tax=Orchesella cincta TaxID=48709 RepID=A0A1D2MSR7_ORCCI|nr:Zinc finger CCHC domain-containing protein 4 [Orchesella cincta]
MGRLRDNQTVPIIRDLALNPFVSSRSNHSVRKAGQDFSRVNHPLSFPNQRDKGEAQYHFNDQTVQFFMDQFENLKFDSVLCVGTPSLHQHITTLPRSSNPSSWTLTTDLNHHHPSIRNSSQKLENWQSSSTSRLASKWSSFGMDVSLEFFRIMENILASSLIHGRSYFEQVPSSGLEMSDFHVEYLPKSYKYSGAKPEVNHPQSEFSRRYHSPSYSPRGLSYCDNCSKWWISSIYIVIRVKHARRRMVVKATCIVTVREMCEAELEALFEMPDLSFS